MNDNTFTLEDAMESINSYISEANAYNKYMDNRRDEIKKLSKNAKKYKAIENDSSTPDSVRKAAGMKAKTAIDKINEIRDAVTNSTGRKQQITGDGSTDEKSGFQFSYRKRGYKGKDRPDVHQLAREGKKIWMQKHGDAGEDKVASRKPGRFKTESIEDKISASRLQVFDAFESGLIDEDEKYAMLEMLDIENYE